MEGGAQGSGAACPPGSGMAARGGGVWPQSEP